MAAFDLIAHIRKHMRKVDFGQPLEAVKDSQSREGGTML